MSSSWDVGPGDRAVMPALVYMRLKEHITSNRDKVVFGEEKKSVQRFQTAHLDLTVGETPRNRAVFRSMARPEADLFPFLNPWQAMSSRYQ